MATIDKYKIVVETTGADQVDNLNDAASRAGRSMATLTKIGAAAAVALVGAFGAMAKSAISLSKDMVDLGGLAGMSAGKIYQLSVAAEASGGSFDQTSVMLMKYSKAVDGANKGNAEMISSFAKVGVSAEDLKKLNDEQLFQKVVEGLGSMEDGAAKTALTMKLLGKDAATTDLAKFAEMTKNAVDPRLEENMAKAAAAVDKFKAAFRDIQMAVLMAIGPVLDAFNEVEISMSDISNIASSIGNILGAVFKAIVPVINLLARNFDVLATMMGVAFGAVMLANVAKMTMAMRLFAASNPFTLIAMAVGTLIIVVADLIKKYGGFSNTMKMVANVGIGVLNKMINAYTAFGKFVGNLFMAVGKAIMAGLNPFSNTSAVDELRKGFSNALSSAQKQINSDGPIKFRFAVDPIPQSGAGTSTRTPSPGRLSGLEENTELARQMGSQAASSKETAENMRQQALEARKVTEDLIRQNSQTNEMRRLEIQLLGVASDRADLIKSNAQAQQDALNEIRELEGKIAEEVGKGRGVNQDVVVELQRQVDEKRRQLDLTLELNRAEFERRLELERQNNTIEDTFELLKIIADTEQQAQAEVLRSRVISGKLSQEEYQNRMRIVDLESEFEQRRLSNLQDLRRAQAAENDAAIEAINLRMSREQIRFDFRKKQIEEEIKLELKLRNSAKAGAREAFEQAKRAVEPFNMANQAVNSLFSNMNSAIDNFVNTGKFKFGDFARSIIADIIKIQLKAAATNLFSTILGGIGLFGRAAGGPVQRNTPYLVGESGPELFVPGSMGSILTNASLNKSSPTSNAPATKVVNNYITNNISAIDSKSVAQMFVENRKALLGAATIAQKEMPYGS